jgi:hypothetical protein
MKIVLFTIIVFSAFIVCGCEEEWEEHEYEPHRHAEQYMERGEYAPESSWMKKELREEHGGEEW